MLDFIVGLKRFLKLYFCVFETCCWATLVLHLLFFLARTFFNRNVYM